MIFTKRCTIDREKEGMACIGPGQIKLQPF